MKSAVIYVTYDGAINSTCGVGVLSQYFVKSMPQVSATLHKDLKVDIDFHVIAINLNKDAHGYSGAIKETTSGIVKSLGGALHYIENGTEGTENYGDKNNWDLASKNATNLIASISKNYYKVYTYLIDTPFLNVPKYMPSSINNVINLLVPHSDVYSHFPENIPRDRLDWESEAFKTVNKYSNTYLASTSLFLNKIINQHHSINERKIIELQTGLLLSDSRFELSNIDEIRNRY